MNKKVFFIKRNIAVGGKIKLKVKIKITEYVGHEKNCTQSGEISLYKIDVDKKILL